MNNVTAIYKKRDMNIFIFNTWIYMYTYILYSLKTEVLTSAWFQKFSSLNKLWLYESNSSPGSLWSEVKREK